MNWAQFSSRYGRGVSTRETSKAFENSEFMSGLSRDRFLGTQRCVVCGHTPTHPTPIVVEQDRWAAFREHRWVPTKAMRNSFEPRNGISLCSYHRVAFQNFLFFIRYVPSGQARKYFYINHCQIQEPILQSYHGKAIALDVNDPLAPFPLLLLTHEKRVRAEFLFAPHTHALSPTAAWQDWIVTEGLFDDQTRTFYRDARETTTLQGTPLPSGICQLSISFPFYTPTSEELTKEILYETRAMPSWKACRREWKKRRMTGVDLELGDSSDCGE